MCEINYCITKCALDIGQLSMCTTTTNMRYDKDCVEFFSLFNLMFGSSAINILRGTAHFGTLVDVMNQRGLYDCLKNLNLRIRNSFWQCQRLVVLAKENLDNVQHYNARMSFLHQNSADCEQVYKSGLETQKFILCSLTKLNQMIPPEDHLILSKMPNCFQLLDPHIVAKHVDLKNEANSNLIKQHTPEWEVLCKSCRVTGSTLHKALSLDGLAQQKEHHHTFLCGHSEWSYHLKLRKNWCMVQTMKRTF